MPVEDPFPPAPKEDDGIMTMGGAMGCAELADAGHVAFALASGGSKRAFSASCFTWKSYHMPASGAASSPCCTPRESTEAHLESKRGHFLPLGSVSLQPSDSPGVLSQK